MKKLFVLLFIGINFWGSCKDNNYNNLYIKDFFYLQKAYYYLKMNNLKMIKAYTDSIVDNEKFTPFDLIKYSECMLFCGDTTKAKKIVSTAIFKGAEYDWISTNEKFEGVFTKCDSLYFSNLQKEIISKINLFDFSELFSMYEIDQFARKKYMMTRDSIFLSQMNEVDSLNSLKLFSYIDKNGWNNNYTIEKYLFPLFLHVTSFKFKTKEEFEKYQNYIYKKEVLSGNMSPQTYAVWVDRFYVFNLNKKEIYGTFWKNIDGKKILEIVDDSQNIDEKRKSIGLLPLDEYCTLKNLKLPTWYKNE